MRIKGFILTAVLLLATALTGTGAMACVAGPVAGVADASAAEVSAAGATSAGASSLAEPSLQQPQTPEQKDKQLYEHIQKQVENYSESLTLEDWQIFYADSILTHNYLELSKEYEAQSKQKVSDSSIYQLIQDHWMEQTYLAFHRILSEEQWQKYLKSGAAKAKKARDKRAEKAKKL